jgi:hypothetical protein
MLILALAAATPTPLSNVHKRDIACVVEVAILAEQQRRGQWNGPDVQASGKRWTGIVGARIVAESGQPKELVAFAMQEAAKARADKAMLGSAGLACIRQMNAELAVIDAATAPLPKPVKAQ